MRSLFIRFWLAFLTVMGVALIASLGMTYFAAVRQSSEAEQLVPGLLAASAQQRLTTDGVTGLEKWTIEEIHRQPEVYVYFIDPQGHDIFGRRLRGQPIAASIGRSPPIIKSRDGTVYRVFVRRIRGVAFDAWYILLTPRILIPLVLAVSALGCALLAWLMTRPVRRLRAGVRQVADGNLDIDIGGALAARRDELGGLARDFGQMTCDLRALIASKEDLLKDVSHELRSPLARLRLAADLARRDGADRSRAFDRIDREVERIDALVRQILQFSRAAPGQPLERAPVDMRILLEEVVEDAQIEADDRQVRMRLVRDTLAIVSGDQAKLRSAIENVLRNAVRYAPANSAVTVRMSSTSAEISIAVSDAGAGTGDSDPSWVFEPFKRGEASDGAGLGLALARRIIEQHGGRVSAHNLAEGFCIDLALPRLAETTAPELD